MIQQLLYTYRWSRISVTLFSLFFSKNVTRQHSCQNNNISSKHVVTAPKRNTPLTAIHENQNSAKLYTHTRSPIRPNETRISTQKRARVTSTWRGAVIGQKRRRPPASQLSSPRLMRPSRWRSGRVDETRNHTIESWITINSIYAAVGRIRRERDSGFRGRGPSPWMEALSSGFDVHLITRQADIGLTHWPRTANSFSNSRLVVSTLSCLDIFRVSPIPVFLASHFAVRHHYYHTRLSSLFIIGLRRFLCLAR